METNNIKITCTNIETLCTEKNGYCFEINKLPKPNERYQRKGEDNKRVM